MKRPEPSGLNSFGKIMEEKLTEWFRTQVEWIGIQMDLPARIKQTLDQAFESFEAQYQSRRRTLAQQLGVPHGPDFKTPIHPGQTPSFDPADILIARCLKDWSEEEDTPQWLRVKLLENAAQPLIALNWTLVLRMTLEWLLSSGLGLISLLIREESLIFAPSNDSYYWNRPHMSRCIIHARVRDTFLLEAGLYGVIG